MNFVVASALLLSVVAAEPIAPLPVDLVGHWADDDIVDPNLEVKGRMVYLDAVGPGVLVSGMESFRAVHPLTSRKVAPKFDAKTGRLVLSLVRVEPKTYAMDLSSVGPEVAQFSYDPKLKALIPIDEKGQPLNDEDGKPAKPLRHRTKVFSEQDKKAFFGG